MTVIPFTSGSIEENVNVTNNPVDFYQVELIGGVDYVGSALGASNLGGTLQDPLLAVFDSQGTLLQFEDDSFALGEDPLLQFRAPASGTYFVGVSDISVLEGTSSGGSYTFTFDQAGPPVFFGGLDSFATFGV